MTDADEQISPAAIARCDLCKVPNFAIGGRTRDGRFHPEYLGEKVARDRVAPRFGKRGWCGRTGPEFLLRIERIVCTPVDTVDGELKLCQRCAHESQVVAA